MCRNIPQSAIKFFVFEKLMRAVYARAAGRAAGALPALAVGGIAGSTAAMFTTPFDTVKTRLQTVGIAGVDGGGIARGVAATARDVVAAEGVGGLYRGLLPRLFIYVTQGAVFFSSYELVRASLLQRDWARDEEEAEEDAR